MNCQDIDRVSNAKVYMHRGSSPYTWSANTCLPSSRHLFYLPTPKAKQSIKYPPHPFKPTHPSLQHGSTQPPRRTASRIRPVCCVTRADTRARKTSPPARPALHAQPCTPSGMHLRSEHRLHEPCTQCPLNPEIPFVGGWKLFSRAVRHLSAGVPNGLSVFFFCFYGRTKGCVMAHRGKAVRVCVRPIEAGEGVVRVVKVKEVR